MAHKNKTNFSAYKARQARRSPPTELRGQHRKPTLIHSLEEADDRLQDLFRNHGAEWITHPQRREFARFYRLLMEEQEQQNFTRLLKIRDIGIKHFVDSALVDRLTRLQFPLLDVGTGPGFPGIPLKILHPHDPLLLAEGVQKRVAFLKKVREQIGFEKLDIVGRNINRYFYYPVRGVITRAVEDMRNTLGNVSSCLDLGGRVYFMKGPGVDPEIPMALDAWGEYYRLVEDHAYEIPRTPHQRRLVVFEKIKHPPLANEEEQDFPLLEDER